MAASLAFLQACLSFEPISSAIVVLSAAVGPFSTDLGLAHPAFAYSVIAVAVRIAGTAGAWLAGKAAVLPSLEYLQDSRHSSHSDHSSNSDHSGNSRHSRLSKHSNHSGHSEEQN